MPGFPTLEGAQDRLSVDTPTLDADLDRVARGNSVKNAVAITEMEGGQPSAYCREQLALFGAKLLRSPGYSRQRVADSLSTGSRPYSPEMPESKPNKIRGFWNRSRTNYDRS